MLCEDPPAGWLHNFAVVRLSYIAYLGDPFIYHVRLKGADAQRSALQNEHRYRAVRQPR